MKISVKIITALLTLVFTASLLFACGGSGDDTTDTSGDNLTETAAGSDTEESRDGAGTSDTVKYEERKYSGEQLVTSRVSVHDPSIVYNQSNGKYYIFGTHRGWAISDDLASWRTFSLQLDNKYESIFESNIKWSSHGDANYDVSGNMWAPCVFYNEEMDKWCMYMSINGNSHYSSIALATADKINGNYTYAGTVVYSGFTTKSQLAETDFEQVTGKDSVPARYRSGNGWNSQYGTNAIDPCVFYDKNGDLWMSYGSWFGGLFLLKLDNETGLRDYSYTYTTKVNISDEYMGIKISGGYGCTGEGSYIVWDPSAGYYYLYVSYCGLNATDNFSGYHIRLFRSENVTGPYVDAAGNEAICKSASENQSNKGVKLFGNYYFSSLKGNGENSRDGYMSPGHNSAFIDSDGERYLVYHTRFNLGNEWHEVRVHQQFMNEDGWPVTAVYDFQGSVISDDGYDEADIIGEYEYVDHGLAAATIKTGMLKTQTIQLNSDGTISGDVTGTWEQHKSSDGKGYYATIMIKDATYKGVFFLQRDESRRHKETMTFSLIGDNNRSIWGSKLD